MEKFGDRIWINIEHPDLLNYENVQVLLIGARKKDVINTFADKEYSNMADVEKSIGSII